MRPHRFDPISFVFGIVFLGLAVALSIDTIDIGEFGIRWIAAGVLLVLGLVMLIGNRVRTDDRP